LVWGRGDDDASDGLLALGNRGKTDHGGGCGSRVAFAQYLLYALVVPSAVLTLIKGFQVTRAQVVFGLRKDHNVAG